MTQKAFIEHGLIKDIGPDMPIYPEDMLADVPDNAQLGWVKRSDGTYGPWVMPPAPPQTIFAPREFIALFTPAEQGALVGSSDTNIKLFVMLATSGPVDVTLSEVIADIHAVRDAGLLTADRAAQILAGTPAPSA